MQRANQEEPFLYEIKTGPIHEGLECALWPSLYFNMCESGVHIYTPGASGKLAYMHKVISPVYHYALNFELLQYNYDRWQFKTITGAINSSRASGCSPNTGLQDKSFSVKF